MFRRLLGQFLALAALAFGLVAATTASASPASAQLGPSDCGITFPTTDWMYFLRKADIYDAMVANNYVHNPLITKTNFAQFTVVFDPIKAKVNPNDIESVKITGPNNYSYSIVPNRAFSYTNLNGFIDDTLAGRMMYVGLDGRGFLANGEYTTTVKYKDGYTTTKKRTLTHKPAMVTSYVNNKPTFTYTPTGKLPAATNLSQVKLTWKTLANVGGPMAYYSVSLSKPLQGGIDQANLVYTNDIYGQAPFSNLPGLNTSNATVNKTLAANTPYRWGVTMSDSNCIGKINTLITPPSQLFTTP